LEPNTFGVWHPETIVVQIGVSDEVFATAQTWIQTVGLTIEGGNRHSSLFSLSVSVITNQLALLFFLYGRGSRQILLINVIETHEHTGDFKEW